MLAMINTTNQSIYYVIGVKKELTSSNRTNDSHTHSHGKCSEPRWQTNIGAETEIRQKGRQIKKQSEGERSGSTQSRMEHDKAFFT